MTDDWVLTEDGLMYWPRCTIAGCVNRICLAKGETRFCWPHSSSGKTVTEILAEAAAEQEEVEAEHQPA